jgi:putative acetyltransferase
VAQGSDPRTRALPSLHLELFWIEKDSNVLTEDYPPVVLDLASSAEDLEHVRELFQEYASSLGVDLSFQAFEEELLTLPGEYAPPRGCLFLAYVGHTPAGCCALRPLDNSDYPNAAEMKRLYVRKAFRGFGLGRQLAEATLDAARQAGYACVLLDTLDDMEAARTLYGELGFEEVPPYYHNPLFGAHYLKADIF